jgi:glycosyltransferase involved in cell wall biosynthesis
VTDPDRPLDVAHLTTVDSSLRFLLYPQLRAVLDAGGTAYGISSPGPWVDGLTDEGVVHLALYSSTRSMNPLADLRAVLELWRLLRRHRIDVLHTHNPKPGLYGRVIGRLAGVPIVVNTVHGLYATTEDPVVKRAIVYVLEAIASRFSDAELVQNPEDLELMGRLRLAAPGKLRLLGNGVDLSRYDPGRVDATERDAARAEIGAGPETVVVGTVGRLVAEKGFREIFAAASRLGPDYRVVAIGPADPAKADGLGDDELDQARAAGVCLLGERLDLPRWYAAMNVFVLASHREGFPRAAMEAAAMGLPIIATDIRGCRQIVSHGHNGLLFGVGDVPGLVAAVHELGGDGAIRGRMGAMSRQRALEEFDERRVVAVVMDTYAACRSRRRGWLAASLSWMRPRSGAGSSGP